MAKLPAGWILIPKTKDGVTVLYETRELVKCKDCKHSKRMCQPWNDLICQKHGGANTPEWFCADGERRDGDG